MFIFFISLVVQHLGPLCAHQPPPPFCWGNSFETNIPLSNAWVGGGGRHQGITTTCPLHVCASHLLSGSCDACGLVDHRNPQCLCPPPHVNSLAAPTCVSRGSQLQLPFLVLGGARERWLWSRQLLKGNGDRLDPSPSSPRNQLVGTMLPWRSCLSAEHDG